MRHLPQNLPTTSMSQRSHHPAWSDQNAHAFRIAATCFGWQGWFIASSASAAASATNDFEFDNAAMTSSYKACFQFGSIQCQPLKDASKRPLPIVAIAQARAK